MRGRSITLTLLVFALRVLPRRHMLLRKERKPSDHARMEWRQTLMCFSTKAHSSGERCLPAPAADRETFSAENSCRDTPVAPSCPNPQWNQPADKQTKSRGGTRAEYHFNASSIETNVYRGVCVRRNRHNTEGSTLLTLQWQINANQAADGVQPVIVDLCIRAPNV